DPAVWHVLHEHVRHHVIDRYSARSGAVEHLAGVRIVGSEIIKRQWRRAGSERFQRLVNAAIAEYWQDRPKDFLAHHQRVARRIESHDRHHATRARWSGGFEDAHYFTTSGLSVRHQPLQSCKVCVTYDRRVVGGFETVRMHAMRRGD